MKGLFLSLITIVTLVAASSCGSSSKSATTDSDSTAIVDETAEEPQLFETPDLALLEVKGNVKEIKGKTTGDYVYSKNARFDKEGRLTHYGWQEPIDKISNVERDSEGKLTNFLGSEWISVTWDAEMPLSVTLSYNECSNTETYKYANKRIAEISTLTVDLIEGTENTSIATVIYPADGFDANGNWVKRFVKYPSNTEIQVREIIYY